VGHTVLGVVIRKLEGLRNPEIILGPEPSMPPRFQPIEVVEATAAELEQLCELGYVVRHVDAPGAVN